MKAFVNIAVLCFMEVGRALAAESSVSINPDSLGLPGDNLNLNEVLNLFREAPSVESFEKQLNSPDTKVNNLDLNNDGKVDYLRVQEHGKKNDHTLVIQDMLGKKDIQDVAVINVTKNGDASAHVQIIGDEALYGKNYIIEPKIEKPAAASAQAVSTDTANGQGQPGNVTNNYVTNNYSNYHTGYGGTYGYYNAWGWPCVSLMFGPGYVYWNSPFYWGYYPGWWNPWRPMLFASYYGYWGYRPYYAHYCRTFVVVGHGFRTYNRSYRSGSPVVRSNMASGAYAQGSFHNRSAMSINRQRAIPDHTAINQNHQMSGMNSAREVRQAVPQNQFHIASAPIHEAIARPAPEMNRGMQRINMGNSSFNRSSFEAGGFRGGMGGFHGMSGGMGGGGHMGGGRR